VQNAAINSVSIDILAEDVKPSLPQRIPQTSSTPWPRHDRI
jgi:hypothetical protein